MKNVYKILLAMTSIYTFSEGGQYKDQVRNQLSFISSVAYSDGWTETHNTKIDSLREGNYDYFSFNLARGNSYKIVGVCDKDCKDLDLVLYDENNNEISKDFTTDSLPVVEVNPKWSGRFKLKVKMYSCKTSPCFYGISVLGK